MVQVLKRSLLFLVALFLLSVITHAQSAFQPNATVVQVGIGVGRSPHFIRNYNYSNFFATPLVLLSFEKGLGKEIGPGVFSIGAQVGWRSTRYRSVTPAPLGWYEEKDVWSDWGLAARLLYHLSDVKNKNLDVYGGVAAGPTFSRRYTYAGYQNGADYSLVSKRFLLSTWNSGFILGGRYYFGSKVAVSLEGQWLWRMSNLNVGVALKLG